MRVLIADSNSRRAIALSVILSADPGLEILRYSPQESLIDAVRSMQPDIVLVDMGLADRDALDSVRALAGSDLDRPVALFVDRDDETLMRDAFDAGICSYNVVDTLSQDIKPVLRAAITLYERFRSQARALSAAQQTLIDQEMIARAKRLFMKREQANETAAHRWFQKRSMQDARRMADICRDYLRDNSVDSTS